jgi:hypothetical protein
MSDEELVQRFVSASTRRVRKIANLFGGGALALIVLGILGAVTIAPELGAVAGLGGALLLPALYVSRRMAHLTGPTSPLATLLSAPTQITDAELHTITQRGVREESVTVKTASGSARYPVAFHSTFASETAPSLVAADVTAVALHAAIRRRAGLPA